MATSVDETDFITALKNRNILISSMGGGKLRMVTHLAVTKEMVAKVVNTLKELNI